MTVPVLERMAQELEQLRPTESELEAMRRRQFEKYLDRGYGECWLRRHKCAQLLHDALLQQNGARYMMHAFVIMPNHVHLLAHFLEGYEMGDVVRDWKHWSAHEINITIGRQGVLWQADYWDRYIRDAEHYDNSVHYIRMNPVRAGLVKNPSQWRWTWLADWLK
jgi:REP element-mobilizing transposase RayT